MHGPKNPGPGPPWQTLAAIKCPIPYALPSAMLRVPHTGSKSWISKKTKKQTQKQ